MTALRRVPSQSSHKQQPATGQQQAQSDHLEDILAGERKPPLRGRLRGRGNLLGLLRRGRLLLRRSSVVLALYRRRRRLVVPPVMLVLRGGRIRLGGKSRIARRTRRRGTGGVLSCRPGCSTRDEEREHPHSHHPRNY